MIKPSKVSEIGIFLVKTEKNSEIGIFYLTDCDNTAIIKAEG